MADASERPRRRPPAVITLHSPDERRFQTWVTKTAHFWGWCGFHISFSKGAVTGVHMLGLGDDHYDSDGFPDWVFWHARHGLLFRELKRKGAYLSPAQRGCHARMKAAGLDVEVWKPGDEELVVTTFRGVT